MTNGLISCVHVIISPGFGEVWMSMWVCGRYLEGIAKTAWAVQTYPRMLQSHTLLLNTCSSVWSLIAIQRKTVNMVALMSSVKYASKLIEPNGGVEEASITAIQKHRSHSTPAVEGQSYQTSPSPWELILSPSRHCQNGIQGHGLVSAGELLGGRKNSYKLLVLEVQHRVTTQEWE